MDATTLTPRAISMLYPEALAKLTEVGAATKGGILELGPYIGGSTAALAIGNRGRFPHAVIECGGALERPDRASTDIIADWKLNMERFGFRDSVLLCAGYGYDPDVQAKAVEHVSPIGLLFMDADGFVAPPLKAFSGFMQPDCILAIDDYWAPGAEEKALAVKPFVDAMVEAGHLIPDSLEGGTWFGWVNGPAALEHFSKMVAIRRDVGHCFLTPTVNAKLCDTPSNPTQSRLRLFEDGRELGPAHTAHDDVRASGGGGFSHWDAGFYRWLFWSTSDKPDPVTNGRVYEADWGAGRVPLAQV